MLTFPVQDLKQEIRTLEDLQLRHETASRRQDLDPDKMADRIKKLGMSLDLTNQRCQNYEAKVKELQGMYALLVVLELLYIYIVGKYFVSVIHTYQWDHFLEMT